MNPELIAYIQDAIKNNVLLYQVRSDLLAAGWSVDMVDAHIRYVKENPGATPASTVGGDGQAASGVEAPAVSVSQKKKIALRSPGCGMLIVIGVILLLGSLFTEGFVSQILFSAILGLFWGWIIFWGGDARLEGSFIMGLLAFPGATSWRREGIRLFAWFALLAAVGNMIYYAVLAGQPRWDPFIWPDSATRQLMGTNKAYWHEQSFATYDECANWFKAAPSDSEKAFACGRNCRSSGVQMICKELR